MRRLGASIRSKQADDASLCCVRLATSCVPAAAQSAGLMHACRDHSQPRDKRPAKVVQVIQPMRSSVIASLHMTQTHARWDILPFLALYNLDDRQPQSRRAKAWRPGHRRKAQRSSPRTVLVTVKSKHHLTRPASSEARCAACVAQRCAFADFRMILNGSSHRTHSESSRVQQRELGFCRNDPCAFHTIPSRQFTDLVKYVRLQPASQIRVLAWHPRRLFLRKVEIYP